MGMTSKGEGYMTVWLMYNSNPSKLCQWSYIIWKTLLTSNDRYGWVNVAYWSASTSLRFNRGLVEDNTSFR